MPTRKKTSPKPPALTADDVSWLRSQVGSGDKPPVIVRAASAAVPAGTRGHVIRMGNPSEGEFIVVRLGRDEVPFAPGELALSPRARSASRSAPAKTAATKSTAAKSAPAKTAAARSAGAKRTTASAAPKRAARTAPAKATPTKTATKAAPPAKAATSTRGRRSASKRGAAQPLTVTVRFADGRWTVEAQRGSRRLARPSILRPGAVKAFADFVDEEAIRGAITHIVESGRAVIEERAQKLRAELQAAEESLRDFEARRR